jgi:hypothetical protein
MNDTEEQLPRYLSVAAALLPQAAERYKAVGALRRGQLPPMPGVDGPVAPARRGTVAAGVRLPWTCAPFGAGAVPVAARAGEAPSDVPVAARAATATAVGTRRR